jgi:peptidoglycan/LPS O-acetylase OafA/YrhL
LTLVFLYAFRATGFLLERADYEDHRVSGKPDSLDCRTNPAAQLVYVAGAAGVALAFVINILKNSLSTVLPGPWLWLPVALPFAAALIVAVVTTASEKAGYGRGGTPGN